MSSWITSIITVVALVVPSVAGGDERAPRQSSGEPANGSVPDSSWAAVTRLIDDRIRVRLSSEGIPPSPASSDAEFLRRVYLDLHGVVPSVDRVRSFLDDRTADKRARVIDQLLDDQRFAAHLADIWDDYLIPAADDSRSNKQRLNVWLEEAFRDKSWDRIAYELLTASGQRDKNATVAYLLKGRETLTPAELTDLVSQYFLGMRLNCAQCHDHPFAPWTQADYWGMAAFFTEIQYTDRRLQKSGLIRDDPTVAIDKLEHAEKLRTPRYLGADQPSVPSGVSRREALARWLTAADNPYFSRAMVNRLWWQFFGRGLVEPVDDMHQNHPPSHPELLADLCERFTASGFDVRNLCRAICNSAAYQRTSLPAAGNERDSLWYSHMAVKVFTPEQLFDSLSVVLPRMGAVKGDGRKVDAREEFVQFFRSEGDGNPTAYDRGIPQTLRMMNSSQLLSPRNESAIVQQIIGTGTSESLAIESLYLQGLARRPTDDERGILAEFLATHPGPREQAYAEILWGLLNSSEFTLNH